MRARGAFDDFFVSSLTALTTRADERTNDAEETRETIDRGRVDDDRSID